ncbi:DegT/DnrJ/EryC1/StrS family aminotransferase [Litorilinea aerophila]|uniref:Aminotransferase class V-fold PLP-dependent enzyme n=1 Tax=Litorilinea aerophila TaxID=1204385 RepID=A0A540VI72_9CHLR|nr:DegT/DnrJ/EryC1/StrS family aminotransferase [Litorilinea aerophila]MCC9076106.1 DegT/DnrJ/EryC1/StrS family aminotransferase [Litorilinea aerophila]
MPRHLPPTAAPLPPWTEVVRAAAAGPETEAQFADALAHSLGVPHCFLAASGRTALFLLLHTLRRQATSPAHGDTGPRDEVLLPAYTCPSLVKVILDAGLSPRLVDIRPDDLQMDRSALYASLGERTLAVIWVHPLGIPHPVAPVLAEIHRAGARLIEDAAQSLGARLDGQPVGTWGDFGLFSFGPGKPLSLGGGGLLCTRDPEAAQALATTWQRLSFPRGWRSWMALARLWAFGTAFHPTGWWLATRLGAQRVGEHEASWGYARQGLSPAQARVGLALLPQLEAINRRRQAHARQLLAGLAELASVRVPLPVQPALAGPAPLPRPATQVEPIYLRLPLLAESEARREALYRRLQENGIGAGRLYGKTLAEYFPQLAGNDHPGARSVAKRLLTLPTHHHLRPADLTRMVDLIRDLARG